MLSDGTVLIDAPKVVIGSNATEAMVLGNELKKLLSRVLDSMTSNMDKFVATGAGPGILNPAILDAIIKTHDELDKMLSKISKVK
jgi:hypothetical protein